MTKYYLTWRQRMRFRLIGLVALLRGVFYVVCFIGGVDYIIHDAIWLWNLIRRFL